MDSPEKQDAGTNIVLKDAIERCAQHVRMNAYSYYRGQAALHGSAYFGPTRVAVFKVGSRWMVSEQEIQDAVAVIRQRNQDRQEATAAYADRRLSDSGTTVETEWGSYSVRGLFHRMTQRPPSSPVAVSSWRCNECFRFATTEHDHEECHLCRDWSGCNRDCTLSAARCDTCGTRMELGHRPAASTVAETK
ncbi:hypothetical protein ACVWY0_001071 [Arthrobacter sp. UYNi723]